MAFTSTFVTTFELKQQTPMIHFQHSQEGVCLRASEVKPKLDRFIVDLYEKKGVDIPKEWYIDAKLNKALNYKLRFIAPNGELTVSETIKAETDKIQCGNKNKYRLIPKGYFGNMIQQEKKASDEEKIEKVKNNYKESIFYKNPISGRIFCPIPALSDIIKEHLIGFFLINNFGTRQSKGFGGFTIEKVNGKTEPYDMIEKVRIYTPAVYKVEKDIGDYESAFNDISIIYSLMKGGINFTKIKDKDKKTFKSVSPDDYFRGFIYKYFYTSKNIVNAANDKAYIKQKILADQHRSETQGEKFTQVPKNGYRFVRIVLGMPGFFSYKNNTTVHIYNKSGIDRFKSPVTFKFANGILYFIPSEIPSVIFNKPFCFSVDDVEHPIFSDNEIIYTPESFDLIKFLDAFVEYYNDKDSPKDGKIGLCKAENNAMQSAKTLKLRKW